ncbi:MAG TPA: DUF2631 domain-containing protein [Jatrophihabitantaceae bacterium]|nr:DUF2631 domain-containing protein [Jatrophihabitantaceae bacterium]
MALNAHSEQPDLSLPDDYKADHPNEHPTDWGWHGEWGRAGRFAGWVVIAILLLMITSTHYNFSGGAWLAGFAVVLFIMQLWDIRRRKNSWRK